jgi:phosphatidylglycerol:prolipoprotein diacylglycerol transferase
MSIINCFRIKNKYKWFLGIVIALVVNAIAIFGAYLLFHIEEPTAPLASFGLSFFGTVYFLPIGMHFVSYCFRKYSKKEFRDLWALTVPMELSLVRLGCFFAGCCLGVQAHHGVHFPNDPEGFYRVPIQLIEVVFDVGIFILLIVLEKKKINKGYLYPIFMVSYGFIRFILEFWRDTAKHFYGLSNGQIFAFISVIIGCIWIMLLYRKKENVR